jgi:hypothetical protein
VSDDLTSTVGVVAIAAGALALVALVIGIAILAQLRRLRATQTTILGQGEHRDLLAHAEHLERSFEQLRAHVEQTFQQLDQRLAGNEHYLQRCISHAAVVRYDAYNEMSGHQSSSLALLDGAGNGLVLSSILHREQARTYVKGVHDGRPDVELSPEETDAVNRALGRAQSPAAQESAQ